MRKFSPEFKDFILDLFRKFGPKETGHVRAVLCRVFDLNPSVLSSWLSKRFHARLHRDGSHRGCHVLVVAATLLLYSYPEQRVAAYRNEDSTEAAQDVASAGGCKTLRRSVVSQSILADRALTGLPRPVSESVVVPSSCGRLRPWMGAEFDDAFRARCEGLHLPVSLEDAERMHISRHSLVFAWRWPTKHGNMVDVVTYVIKVYQNSSALVREKTAFVMLAAAFTDKCIPPSQCKYFCFPVAESSWEVSGVSLNCSALVYEHFSAMTLGEISACFRQSCSNLGSIC